MQPESQRQTGAANTGSRAAVGSASRISQTERWVVELKRDEMPGDWDGVEYSDSEEAGLRKLREWEKWREETERPHIRLRLVKITKIVELVPNAQGEAQPPITNL